MESTIEKKTLYVACVVHLRLKCHKYITLCDVVLSFTIATKLFFNNKMQVGDVITTKGVT